MLVSNFGYPIPAVLDTSTILTVFDAFVEHAFVFFPAFCFSIFSAAWVAELGEQKKEQEKIHDSLEISRVFRLPPGEYICISAKIKQGWVIEMSTA